MVEKTLLFYVILYLRITFNTSRRPVISNHIPIRILKIVITSRCFHEILYGHSVVTMKLNNIIAL